MMPAISASNPQRTMNIRFQAALVILVCTAIQAGAQNAAALTAFDPDTTWRPTSADGPSN
jgi:hypothetical protein